MESTNTPYEELKAAGIIHRDTELSEEEVEFVNRNLSRQEVETLKCLKVKIKPLVIGKDPGLPQGFGF